MTYGHWLDASARALAGAQEALLRASVGDYSYAAEVVAERDTFLAALTRLAGLVSGLPSAHGASRWAGLDAAVVSMMKDPTAKMLLQAMPAALALKAGRDEVRYFHTTAAELLHSAAEATSIAGDILVSHVDPINGPRTPEGAAIRLGAGRSAALADLADVMTEFAKVDQQLLEWLEEGRLKGPSTFGVLHRDLIVALRSSSTGGVHPGLRDIAANPREPDLLRQLDVAAALGQPERPRFPTSLAECGELVDDFRLWAYRHPGRAGARHISAATRVGLLIATISPGSAAVLDGWHGAARALRNIAAQAPQRPDLRAAELGNIADMLRTESVTHRRDDVFQLGLRLPGLADTVDAITRQVVQRGDLLARKPATNSAAAAFGTPSTWAIAAHADAAVETLLDGLKQAGAVPIGTGLSGSQARRAFPQVRTVRTGASRQRLDERQTTISVRSRRR